MSVTYQTYMHADLVCMVCARERNSMQTQAHLHMSHLCKLLHATQRSAWLLLLLSEFLFAKPHFQTPHPTPCSCTRASRWAAARDLLWIPSLGPGYDDRKIRPWNAGATREREGGARWVNFTPCNAVPRVQVADGSPCLQAALLVKAALLGLR